MPLPPRYCAGAGEGNTRWMLWMPSLPGCLGRPSRHARWLAGRMAGWLLPWRAEVGPGGKSRIVADIPQWCRTRSWQKVTVLADRQTDRRCARHPNAACRPARRLLISADPFSARSLAPSLSRCLAVSPLSRLLSSLAISLFLSLSLSFCLFAECETRCLEGPASRIRRSPLGACGRRRCGF